MSARGVSGARGIVLVVLGAFGAWSCRTPPERANPDPWPSAASGAAAPGVAAPAAALGPGAGPGSGSSASSGSGSSMPPTLAVKLLASPTQLTMADRPKFMVGVEVVNRGSTAVNPQLSTGCQLTVNGKESMAWNLAIGNGAREPSWDMLPPGQTATMSWPLGPDLFDKPGDYHLVMTLGSQQATADIHVGK
jgi:hypothetical protein